MSTPYIPAILHESAQGTDRYRIEDKMLSDREILLVGTMDNDQVNTLITQLLHLARQDASAPITMYINSPGGMVSSGLALYDVMQAIPCPVHTVCMGSAASMAAVIFAAGDHRALLPHSHVMIHDPLTNGISGSALTIQSLSEDLMRTRETLAMLLAQHTGRPLEEIYAVTAKDTYFYAQAAIDYGLADEILASL